MSWINQFSLVMKSSVTSLRERIEDPERMLHQLLIDMDEELDIVRNSVAEAMADEIQLKRKVDRQHQEVQTWAQRAADAIARGDETQAKAALEQKINASDRAEQFVAEHDHQREEVEKLRRGVRDLEDKIRQAKHKKSLLAAKLTRAASTQKINATLERTHSKSAIAQFNRLEAKVDRQEAIGKAWDQLEGRDHEAQQVQWEFEQQERKQRMEQELEKLKADFK